MTTVIISIIMLTLLLAAAILFLLPQDVSAHCDTMDGPAVKDGRKALETGNINYAYKWIMPEYEAELLEAFTLALKVRGLSSDAQELADRYFLENLVRVHRAGEGASYEGLKPSGTALEPVVVAADEAIAQGSLAPLQGLVTDEEYRELEPLFNEAMARKDFDIDDVPAARSYVEAYVTFFKKAEGEEHDHGHGAGHGHDSGHGHGHDVEHKSEHAERDEHHGHHEHHHHEH